jgi:acyl-CoA dehydrogenase
MTAIASLEAPYDAIQAEAAALGRDVAPLAVEADNSSELHPGVLEAVRASGITRYLVPASFGGVTERVDPFAVCVIREALMAVCSHADSLVALQGIGSYAITTGGREDQKKQWLPSIADGSILPALALTEPGAGSDLRRVETRAEPRSAATLVLRGHKSFISNAGVAGCYTVLAGEDRRGSRPDLSLFLVPADRPGVTATSGPVLAAAHVLGDVIFDGVEVCDEDRIGQPGGALDLVLATLSTFRTSVAGAAVGLAQAALEEATRHARQREQFGRPLLRLGPVAGLLADSWADVASARLLTYEVARLARIDARAHVEHSSLAKLHATEACCRVVDRCVQVMGRWGLVKDSRIERCYRQARPMRVYEGASEVIRLGIARQLAAEVV